MQGIPVWIIAAGLSFGCSMQMSTATQSALPPTTALTCGKIQLQSAEPGAWAGTWQLPAHSCTCTDLLSMPATSSLFRW